MIIRKLFYSNDFKRNAVIRPFQRFISASVVFGKNDVLSEQKKDSDGIEKKKRPTIRSGTGNAVFDRNAKRLQRNRSVSVDNYQDYEFLKSEIAYRVADRVYDVKRFFDVAVDFGSGTGLIAPHMFKENVGTLIQIDMSESMMNVSRNSDEVTTLKLVADEESVPFKPKSIDLAVSSLSMHWINDLPAFFRRVHDSLRPDGVLIASIFGGETLFQLRCALQLAEMERLGGLAAHVSPFTEVRDIGSLMNRAGFKMLTIDVDDIEVTYSSMYTLMYELQSMAENSASWHRAKHLNRDVLHAAAAIYKEMYGKEDGSVGATFQIIYMIGWRASDTTPQPAKRGSGTVSLKDIDTVIRKNDQ